MTDIEWTAWALIVVLLLLVGLWTVWAAASRLDRLHRRVMTSRATLDAQLVRRATAAWDLATADVLDPVSAVLVAEAAREALAHSSESAVSAQPSGAAAGPGGAAVAELTDEPDQAMVESELSRVLRAALGTAEDRAQLEAVEGAHELLVHLDQAWYRVQLARRFYNDAVVQVRRIRAKGYVRLLRLAGRAPVPMTFEMDDATPPA
jgi:hypothetical protein